jgi:hypothetical protein
VTVSYDEAKDIVTRAVASEWEHGTFCLDDRFIVENDSVYAFAIGAREFLIDGDESYAIAGAVPVVHKDDGRLEWLPSPMVAMDETLRSRSNPDTTLPAPR